VVVPEKTLFTGHPAMFRNRPIFFLLCIVLIFFYGIGLVLLLIWLISTMSRTLTVTNKRSTLRKGILAKNTTEVLHAHVRNVQIRQGALQRLFGVGTIAISSAGQSDLEIVIAGIANPTKVKSLIDANRDS
jgi:uncharacterized membrane protein YdbT with pleckstrin-like domain